MSRFIDFDVEDIFSIMSKGGKFSLVNYCCKLSQTDVKGDCVSDLRMQEIITELGQALADSCLLAEQTDIVMDIVTSREHPFSFPGAMKLIESLQFRYGNDCNIIWGYEAKEIEGLMIRILGRVE